MKIKFYILFYLVILVFPVLGREFNGNHDFQFWPHQVFDIKFAKKGTFRLDFEERIGGRASILYHNYIQGNVLAHVCKWLELGPAYRQTWTLNPATRHWDRIYEPMLIIFLKKKVGKWEFNFRNQNHYRIREQAPSDWLVRFRWQVFLPIKLGKKVTPFVEDEIFFLKRVGYIENRLAGGLHFSFREHFASDFIFMYRWIRFPADPRFWFEQSIIRLFLRWNF